MSVSFDMQKTTKKKNTSKTQQSRKASSKSVSRAKQNWFSRKKDALMRRRKVFLDRRPHRSFRLTRRRDYVRRLQLPGYWSLLKTTASTLWAYKSMMIPIVILYAALTFIFLGIISQQIYTTLSDTLHTTSGDIFKSGVSKIGEAGLLLVTGVTGNFSATPSPEQQSLRQIYGILIGLLIWLTTVWSLRAFLAGQRPRFRDALYNAGAPLVATFLVLFVVAVQLLPAALGALVISAGVTSGLMSSGVEAMLIFVSAGLLIVVSLYWVTSSFIALVVVTLPGKYPMQAIRTAGDLVIGRRLRILLRMIWLGFCMAVVWAIVMIPIILVDAWIKGLWSAISWLPVVPVAFLLMSSLSVVFVSAYVYLLYRRIVDDDAKPA